MPETASILVIDDEQNIRKTLVIILEREGYVVSTAATVNEAWRCLEKSSFDLIFLDIKLPDADGLMILPEIHRRYPETKVLILTAQDKQDSALQAIQDGASDYLLKPIDPPDLLARIKPILAAY
jgi:DNA-binding NtrC family response regulator